MSQSLHDFFKDVYCSDDPLDEDHPLTYHFDDVNSMCYDNKKMNTYEVTLQKYGLTHGGSFESSWGYPSTSVMHEEELREKQYSSDYRILEYKFISNDFYNKIKGKITPNGVFVPTKNKHIWTIGEVDEIRKPTEYKLLKEQK